MTPSPLDQNDQSSTARPNIVYILADDLGYGDLRCLNPDSKIPTPNIDRLAAGGMVFSDAHACGAVCTPTRYGILTGRYCFRSPLERGVLGALSPRLIEGGRLTVPLLLKQHGYRTACIGKWHLGMDWPLMGGGHFDTGCGDDVDPRDAPEPEHVNFTRAIEYGPKSVGFEYFFGISGAASQPPFVFIENDRALGIPTVEETFFHTGLADPNYEGIEVLPTIAGRAVEFIGRQGATVQADDRQPFFLYFPLTAPHTPHLPSPEFRGKSGINAYADFVMQVDDTVGRMLDALARAGLADNTLVIFTSDNGCSPQANFEQLHAAGHFPSHHFRGYKADIYEGGHRSPLVVRWPSVVRPGSRCDQLVSLNDLLATCADFLGTALPDDAGEDSVSMMPALRGEGIHMRDTLIHHSFHGSFGIQHGNWKLALCPGSGGWSFPRPGVDDASKLPPIQLFDLASDIGERNNLQDKHPEIVARLTKLLEKQIADGRSTPGPRSKNSREIDIWKSGKEAQKIPEGPPRDTTE